MPSDFKSGFAAIIGRPNVGKSTLMNALIGQKVAIVSQKAQTTRNRIQGVLTGDSWQVVFLDTPGIHKPRTQLGETMMKAVRESLTDTEIIVFVVDGADIRTADEELIQKYASAKCARLLAVNKIDKIDREKLAQALLRLSAYQFNEIIPVSAVTGEGLEDLKRCLLKYLPEGPRYFPEDAVTDMPERFLIAEYVREKALMSLDEEIPHGVGVEIMKIEKSHTGVLHIEATIYCEKQSHKNIIIGKQGSMIGKIGRMAREDIEKLMDCQVNLRLWVKVVPDWRNRAADLRTLGYIEK